MIHDNLRSDCGNCFGFCCVALYFSSSEGFPVDKEAGKPCPNLQEDFRCRAHNNLWELGLKGCTAYDCFGAGQKAAQTTYVGKDWRKAPESAKQMYETFLIIRQLHEMLWYLSGAISLEQACQIKDELKSKYDETERLTLLSPEHLVKLDVTAHRSRVNALLLNVSEHVRADVRRDKKSALKRRKTLGRGLDLIGADLRRADLKGEDLRGAYLIGADLRGADLTGTDLIGADMRDADIRGADLSGSIFLTQSQANTAKGDSDTKLPPYIIIPAQWLKPETF